MGKFWTGVARLIAVLFAMVFVLTTIAAILLVTIDRRLLVSTTYKTALARQQVYARMPRILAEQLVMTMNYNPCASNPLTCENPTPEFKDCARTILGDQRFTVLAGGVEPPTETESKQIQACIDKYQPDLQAQTAAGNSSGGVPALFKSLSVSDMEAVISMLMPPDQLKAQTENILDQVFSYLNGRQDTITVNLVSLKKRLASQAGLDAILKLIRSQPACTTQQVVDMLASLASGKGELVMCRPPEDQLALMAPQIQLLLQAAAAQIPDSREISPTMGQNPTDFGPLGSGPTGGLRFAHLVLRLSPDLPLFFLLLISFLAVRTPKGWLRWWGIPFFFAGLFSVAIGASMGAFFEEGWLALLAGRIPAYLSLGVVTVFHDLARAITQTYLTGIIFNGALLALVGLGLWIGSGFIKKKADPVPPEEPLPVTS